MKEREFDKLVDRVRRQSLPPLSGSLENNVLRRIRLSRDKAESPWTWFGMDWVPRPSVALATMAVVTVSSLVTSTVALRAYEDERPTQARVALGFDAFTAPHHLPLNER